MQSLRLVLMAGYMRLQLLTVLIGREMLVLHISIY